MKKVALTIVSLFISLIVTNNVYAITGLSDIDFAKCNSLSDGYKTITKEEKTYDYTYCIRVQCSGGTYLQWDMASQSVISCGNGNSDPKIVTASDGCSIYNGSCSTKATKYCTKVVHVDCTIKSNGEKYASPSDQTTKPPRSTTTTTTTTTKKTTKATNSTSKTTKSTTKNSTTTTTTTTTTTKLSDNKNISKITINDKDLNFKNEVNSYTVKISSSVKSLDIKVIPEDKKATYEVVNNKDLVNGSIIGIKLKAENGETRIVTINIEVIEGTLSSNCDISNLEVKKHIIAFDKDVKKYTITIDKDEKQLDLDIQLSDDKATYSVSGNSNLKNKSSVIIAVTAEDMTVCKYQINISKKSNFVKIFIILLLMLIAFAIAALIFIKQLKKSKGNYKYE